MVKPSLRNELRILEVGSGLCLLSLFLKSQGFDITALVPLEGGFGFGFGFVDKLKSNILNYHSSIKLSVINKGAQD